MIPGNPRVFVEKVLHHRISYAKDRRIVLCHATNKSGMILSCAIDHVLDTSCQATWTTHYTEDAGQVVATIDAQPGRPITLVKYMSYHTSHTAPPEEMCARAERTLDRAVADGFSCSACRPRTVHGRFLATKRRHRHDESGASQCLHERRPAGHPIQSVPCPAGSPRAQGTWECRPKG